MKKEDFILTGERNNYILNFEIEPIKYFNDLMNPLIADLYVYYSIGGKEYSFKFNTLTFEVHCKPLFCYELTETCWDYGLENFPAKCPEGTHCCN